MELDKVVSLVFSTTAKLSPRLANSHRTSMKLHTLSLSASVSLPIVLALTSQLEYYSP